MTTRRWAVMHYGTGIYDLDVYAFESEFQGAYKLWLDAIEAAEEAAPTGVAPHVFVSPQGVVGGRVSITHENTFNFSDRMYGHYLVVSDPRVVRFCKEIGIFTEVDLMKG